MTGLVDCPDPAGRRGHIHACPRHELRPGQCAWAHHFEDVDLECDAKVVPGSPWCVTHLIEHEQGKDWR